MVSNNYRFISTYTTLFTDATNHGSYKEKHIFSNLVVAGEYLFALTKLLATCRSRGRRAGNTTLSCSTSQGTSAATCGTCQ